MSKIYVIKLHPFVVPQKILILTNSNSILERREDNRLNFLLELLKF